MRKFLKRVVKVLRPMTFMLVSLFLITVLYVYRLGTITPGLAQQEVQTIQASESLDAIVENPVNAPYKLAVWGVGLVTDSEFAIRSISVAASIIVIILFYRIAKRFFEYFYATVGTIMFACSSVMLNTGRIAITNVMLLTLFVLIACGYSLRFHKKKAVAWLVTGLAIGLAMYVPGMIFFIIAGSIWQFKRIKRSLSSVRPALLVSCFVIFAALIAPIVYGLVLDISLAKEFLGMPASFPSPLESIKALLSVPLGVFLIAPENPVLRLGHQPTLDIFAFGMLILGGYTFLRKHALDRTKLLAGIGIITLLWVGVSANYEHSFILTPFIFMLVTGGLYWFGNAWRKVFPTNPLAQSAAMVLLIIGVFFSSVFQLRRYFVAWPNTATTKAAFSEQIKE